MQKASSVPYLLVCAFALAIVGLSTIYSQPSLVSRPTQQIESVAVIK